MQYPKRLIEVDFPIKRISLQAKREKDMRRCHVPLIHIWPATRPPAACRSILLAALWPDPVDQYCPESFKKGIKSILADTIQNNIELFSSDSYREIIKIQKNIKLLDKAETQQKVLFNLIADFANYDNTTSDKFLQVIRDIISVRLRNK